ncbi:MAG: hypothetical protein E5Y51_05605 [Mesorhizobium sp.]|uniref:hypothetical protein n=1 Tax=Mesorhizobium sp. M1A.F.Ca.IN.022.06.1.1 TaxID=2493680 RepID=UPI000F750A45|nr:hypothetical protein [Mesorhizobium sp. M1A.F.Ca.IN.022.06.1.1]AZO61226.1 hypothetical protein EJ078_19675 [Mesorhizobium sp. M1A.F.Ca.IN.022.06.1.1]TIN19677.1 MAG: hypothetical protein E5Y51_05605 [Mesorhizobium sp.]
MIDLKPSITAIEDLLRDGSEASLTYAALECRLAIERICYERLRIAHDYISHDDIKKWQPKDIVNVLIQEVDRNAAATLTYFISREPVPEGTSPLTVKDFEKSEYIPFGTQIGFDPGELGKLWNALAKLALHISIPQTRDTPVTRYGEAERVRKKVCEALEEIKRISQGTLFATGLGEEVFFDCQCGVKNKRRLGLLKNGQTVSCINPDCDESYAYLGDTLEFGRRTLGIVCRKCGSQQDVPKKKVEKLPKDKRLYFSCEGCGEEIAIEWRPMQRQKTMPLSAPPESTPSP